MVTLDTEVDIRRIDSLNELAFTLINADSKQAMAYSIEALKYAVEASMEDKIAESTRTKGIVHWAQGDYADSFTCFRGAMAIYEELEDKAGKASIFSCFGNIYLTQGLLDEALENYLKAQVINEELDDKNSQAKELLNIGNIYMRKNLFDSAISNYQHALKFWEGIEDSHRISTCFNNIGMVLRRKGEMVEAQKCYNKALAIRKDTGDKRGTANTLGNIGAVFEEQNNFEEALRSFIEALKISENLEDKFGIAASCCNIGRILINLESFDSSESYTNRGLEIAREIGAINWEVNCLENLSILMEKKGNIQSALNFSREYSSKKAKLLNEKSSKTIDRLLALYETEKKDREAETLRLKLKYLEKQVRKRSEELIRLNKEQENLVSDCKVAEHAREKAEEIFYAFLENVDDVVYFQSLDGAVSGLNSVSSTLSGHKKQEFEDDPYLWLNLLHADDKKLKLKFLQINHTDKKTDFEYRMYSVTGECYWLNSRMVTVHDKDGILIGYNCIDRDITRRKEADQKLLDSVENLEKSFLSTIYVISKIVETRDPYTSGHQIRTAELAREIARQMDLPDCLIQSIYLAAVVHDIGKIYIPQEFLSKPGSLNSMEMALIRMHPTIGYDILENIELPWPIADIVLQHHELIDGSGYPSGLKGEEISIEARILCVADVIEAMSSHRPYRPSLGIDKAISELILSSGKLYDSEVVENCRILFQEKGYSFKNSDTFNNHLGAQV